MKAQDSDQSLEAQAAALARVEAEIVAAHDELVAIHRRWDDLHQRQTFLQTQIMRLRLKDSVQGYVKLTSEKCGLEPTTTLKPKTGAIGRLVKVGRTRALVDFGEELHTWYVPLAGLGPVSDPLESAMNHDIITDGLDQMIENLHQDILRHDDLTDEERWEDEQL